MLTYKGETLSLGKMAEKHGIKAVTLSYRLNKGWSIEKAIETPPTRESKGRPGKRKEVSEDENLALQSDICETEGNGPFIVYIAFGKELKTFIEKKLYDRIGFEDPNKIGVLLERKFGTEAEKVAYLRGVEDSGLSIHSVILEEPIFTKLAGWNEVDGVILNLAQLGPEIPESVKSKYHDEIRRLRKYQDENRPKRR